MSSETKVQDFVHALEEGGWVHRIRLVLRVALMAAGFFIVILNQFKGLSNDKGMDQAQIGREIASGHGFSTQFIRPIAYEQFVKHLGAFPTGNIPDTYNAPLGPYFDSLLLHFTRKTWPMTDEDIVYTSDRVIAGASLICFFISVFVFYSIAKRLFDERLALIGLRFICASAIFWDYSVTGLPQMLMLLIFSLVNVCLLNAIQNRDAGKNPLLWLALSGVGFGLMVLAHGLAAWIAAGALLYMAFAFLPRDGEWWIRALLHPAWIVALIVVAMEVPWLLRLYHLTGDPFGVALYSGFGQLIGSESQVMRSLHLDTGGLTFSWFRSKVQANVIGQLSSLYVYLGYSPIAPVFFVSLLHLFKRRETASFRWCILWMWLSALIGMSLFGLNETGAIHANDLHVLFVPMMIFYGLAFVMVLWSRLGAERPEINLAIVRRVFLIGLYIISAFPFAHELVTANSKAHVQWPPYVPPYIAILNQWTEPNEVIASDMPWAVAWYADRKSIWLPDTIATFMDLNDYNRLNDGIAGIYLTPVSGDTAFFSDITKGEYKEWSPFILRDFTQTQRFPLGHARTALPMENECIFYSDRNRWSAKAE